MPRAQSRSSSPMAASSGTWRVYAHVQVYLHVPVHVLVHAHAHVHVPVPVPVSVPMHVHVYAHADTRRTSVASCATTPMHCTTCCSASSTAPPTVLPCSSARCASGQDAGSGAGGSADR